ncbi:MAG: hypothetical protein Fur006_60660 [Coleofasciculaceae cyanobacterium]
MPDYQWKLNIIERNLLLSNWMKLMPEAQEQMLEETDELIADLPLPERQRLLTLLEMLQDHTPEEFQRQKIAQILSSPSSSDIRNALELTIRNSHFCMDALI